MKPRTYWDSLNSDERRTLAKRLDKTLDHIGKVLRGEKYVSIPAAVEISKACEDMINPVDLISPANRKALKQLEKKL